MVKRFVAVVLAFLFFVLLPVALLVIVVQTLLLSPDFYKRQLAKVDIYSKTYTEILPALTESVDTPADLPVTKQEITELVRRIVPESFVRQQTEKAIDEVFAYVLSQKDTLRIVVPLGEIKQRIPDEVVGLIEKKVAELPPCPESMFSGTEQQAGFPSQPGLAGGFPTCQPVGPETDMIKSEFTRQMSAELRRMTGDMPDSFDVTEQWGGMEKLRSTLDLPRRLLSDFIIGAEIFYAALVVLVLIVGFLGGNSFNGSVGWIGVTLLVSGVATLVLALASEPFGAEAIASLGGSYDAPKELTDTMLPLASSILSDVVRRVGLEAAGVAALGAMLFYASRKI